MIERRVFLKWLCFPEYGAQQFQFTLEVCTLKLA
jgi:hypothetical protein